MESKIIPIQKKNIISTRITSNILTKYEKARILGFRALQLAMNAKSTLKNVKETDCLKKQRLHKSISFAHCPFMASSSPNLAGG